MTIALILLVIVTWLHGFVMGWMACEDKKGHHLDGCGADDLK